MICTPAASSHLSFAMPLLFLCFSYGETHFDSSKPLSLNLLNIPFPAVSHSLLLAVQLNSRGSPVKLARHLHVSLFYVPTALLNYGSTKILFCTTFLCFHFCFLDCSTSSSMSRTVSYSIVFAESRIVRVRTYSHSNVCWMKEWMKRGKTGEKWNYRD